MSSPGTVHHPVIIEAAINGARGKRNNINVPVSADEIFDCINACVQAGASIIHAHAGQPIVGAGGHHDTAVYRGPSRRLSSGTRDSCSIRHCQAAAPARQWRSV